MFAKKPDFIEVILGIGFLGTLAAMFFNKATFTEVMAIATALGMKLAPNSLTKSNDSQN